MKKLLLIGLTYALILLSCKKDTSSDNNIDPIMELGPKTIIIDNSTAMTIQAVDSTQIIFSGNTEQLQSLAPGSIIISGITANAPNGFLRKISSIVKNGSIYTIKTIQSTLTEAFLSLHIDFTTTSALFSITPPDIILYDVDGNTNTTSDQIKINVNLGLSPRFHIKTDISNFTLDSAKIDGNFEGTLITSITAGGSVGSISKEINIYTQPIGLFTIPGTPIVVTASLRVSLGVNGSINVQVIASDSKSSNINAFIEYKNGKWDKGYVRTMDNQYTFSGLVGNANAKIYVEPAIDFKLWGSDWAKGSITSQGYLQATGQLFPSPSCELKAGISAGAEANLEFFGWTFSAASYPNIFDYSKLLYTCPPQNPGVVTDIDGNIYHTIVIGTQTWLVENLKTSRYRNGDAITTGLSDVQWQSTSSGAFSIYNNNSSNNTTYGKLYNWYAVTDPRQIAPLGWHIPTDAELGTLLTFLGGEPLAGGKLKETGTIRWQAPNTGATNTSGFTGLPGGFRLSTYNDIGLNGNFFSSSVRNSTDVWIYYLDYLGAGFFRTWSPKYAGLSVRCLKD